MATVVKADTLLLGQVLNPTEQYTLQRHQALALAGGRVLAVGTFQDLEGLCSPHTQRLDFRDSYVLPGFNDAHVHIWKVGQLRTNLLDLRGVDSLEHMYALVAQRSQNLQPGQWLWGRGWNEQLLGSYPSRDTLDALCPNNPVLLTRTCAHIHLVNHAALKAAHIEPNSYVAGGQIDFERGLLYETAYGLVFAAMPSPTTADYRRWILAGLDYLHSLGITAATDPAVDPPLYEAYRQLDAEGALPIRVNLLFMRRPDGQSHTYPLPPKHHSAFLRCDSVKFFSDGGLSGATAALSVPYQNSDGPPLGVLRFEDAELFELALEAHQAGFRIGTHAIGDRAIEQVLGVYERLYQASPGPRHRIEHFGLPSSQQLARAAQMGIFAVPQPIFLHELRANFLRYLPPEFAPRCYNLQAMLKAGLGLALSSDGPVVQQLSPLAGVLAACFEPMQAGNQLDYDQAYAAYTLGGALAQGDQEQMGRFVSGAYADLVVVNQAFSTKAALEQVAVSGQLQSA